MFSDTIVQALKHNAVGVMPTDTIYGVVGLLDSEVAVKRMYEVKHRDDAKAVGTILIADTSQIADFVDATYLTLAQKYWPGPNSIIIPVDGYEYAHRGIGSLAFRIPDYPELRDFLYRTGPLATSSANLQAHDPATTIDQARNYFGETVDFYVDGGDLENHQPSNIFRVEEDLSITQLRG